MKLLICIDDTDDIDSKGTGEIAEEICALIQEAVKGHMSAVTRHQLFVHEDIPYTSHNSSMCFELVLESALDYDRVISIAENHLRTETSPVSDPGLCVFRTHQNNFDALIEFGKRAKVEVLTKEKAYAFAKEHHIFLNEYGGTGDGVIGALAGVGLRLSGNDGRFKGKHKIKEGLYDVNELIELLKVDAIVDYADHKILDDGVVRVGGKVKSVLLNHQRVLPVYKTDNHYNNCIKEQLRRY